MYNAVITIVLTSLYLVSLGSAGKDEDRCYHCRFLVETFKAGMEQTKRAHFAGGNTDWEERKLGKFATSETRFIEILESACRKEVLTDSKDYDSVKDIKHKCQTLLEEKEDDLQTWFMKNQETSPDLFTYFCIDMEKRCCPAGHWGYNCEPCPGVGRSLPACFGRGRCDGEGFRSASQGKCKCDKGYVGPMCSNCDAHFYPVQQNDSFIECEECFDGCASGCTSAGPKGCRNCRSGYIWDAEKGCKDVNECLEEGKCTKENEICVNEIGSYRCECKEGHRRNKDHECEIDIEAQKLNSTSSDSVDDEKEEEESTTVPIVDSEKFPEPHSEL